MRSATSIPLPTWSPAPNTVLREVASPFVVSPSNHGRLRAPFDRLRANDLRLLKNLQLLLGHERCEQHVLQAHEGSDVGLLEEHDIAFVVHRQPLEALTVPTESQSVCALQLADVDDAYDFFR